MGEVSGHELCTTDAAAALRFYGELFGWEKVEEHDIGALGPYSIYGRGGERYGGIFKLPADMPFPPMFWLSLRAARGGGEGLTGRRERPARPSSARPWPPSR